MVNPIGREGEEVEGLGVAEDATYLSGLTLAARFRLGMQVRCALEKNFGQRNFKEDVIDIKKRQTTKLTA